MNINCRLTLTDEQLNNIKRHLTGKDIKAKATRAEICELVNDLLEPFLDIYVHVESKKTVDPHACELCAVDGPHGHDCEGVTYEYDPQPELDLDAHPDCCRSVELMRTRMNKLQHHVDTRS